MGIYQVSLMIGPTLPVPVPHDVAEALTSAQVTVSSGQKSGFQLGFTLAKTSLISTVLLPTGYFDPGLRVIITAIVNAIPFVLIDGIITRQEVTPSNEPGKSTLTVTGEDISLLMGLKSEQMCFPNLPPFGRVALILAKYAIYGVVPVVIPNLIPEVVPFTQATPVQSSTDLAYIQKLASETGYSFFIISGPAPGTNVAYWGPEVRFGIPQRALNVNMDAETNVESLSFSYDGLSPVGYSVLWTIPEIGLTINVPLPPLNLLRPPLALRPALPLQTEPLPDVSRLTLPGVLQLGLAKAAQAADAITGTGKLDVLRYGWVLQARQLVGVRGAGLTYDGMYYVKSVTHELKRGEYKQSFTLARDGVVSMTPAVVP